MASPKKKHHDGVVGHLVDKVLHRDSDESDAIPQDDLPVESVSQKVSAGAGASSEGKHQHKKFDKFKKGNR